MAAPDIALHAVSGVKWSTLSQVGRQGMRLAATVVLAHLLPPEDFGLVAMTTVIVGFGLLLRDLGTAAIVVQRKSVTETLVSTVFWVNALASTLLAAALYFGAPAFAALYREARIVPLLEALSLSFLIAGLSIQHQALLQRNLAFRKIAVIEVASTLLACTVGVAAVLLGQGVWSLVYLEMTLAITTTALLWCANPWRPKLHFSLRELRTVSGFGLHLTGYGILYHMTSNADSVIVGRYLGAEALGYYTIASRLMLYPLLNVSWVIERVMFPIYSRIQEDDGSFRSAYLHVMAAVAFVTFPTMVGLFAVAGPFVLTVFGASRAPAIPLLLILAPTGLVLSIVTTVHGVYMAKGRPDTMLRMGIATGALTVAALFIGTTWGTVGVAAAYSLVTCLLAVPSLAVPYRLIGLPLSDLAVTLRPALASSLLMAAGVLACGTLLPSGMRPLLELAILVPLGILLYLAASWVINRRQFRTILSSFTPTRWSLGAR